MYQVCTGSGNEELCEIFAHYRVRNIFVPEEELQKQQNITKPQFFKPSLPVGKASQSYASVYLFLCVTLSEYQIREVWLKNKFRN